MKKVLFLFLLVSAFNLSAVLAQNTDTLKTTKNSKVKYTLLEKPALPLMGIVMFAKSKTYPELDPYPNGNEIPAISKMYKGLHVVGNVVGNEMEASNLFWKKLRKNNP